MRRLITTILAIAILPPIPMAAATQHLVSPGQDWSRLLPRLRPGDEVILMPGRHVAVSLTDLHGSGEKPIIIRGFNAENPALIGAREFGIELINPRFIILRDLHIVGAVEDGVRIDMRTESGAPNEPVLAAVRLQRVRIERSGEYDTGRAFLARGASRINLEHCRIEGWGAAAAQFIGCREITIEHCVFRGTRHHAQIDGVHFRASCRTIWMRHTTIEGVMETCLRLGGGSSTWEFIPPLADAGGERRVKRYEVDQITVEQCMFIGGQTAVSFDSARRLTMRSSTIVRPRLWIFTVHHSIDDERLGRAADHEFGDNIIVWAPTSLRRIVHAEADVDFGTFRLSENLWWAEGGGFDPDSLPFNAAFPQATDIDPRLDAATHLAGSPPARRFGVQPLEQPIADAPWSTEIAGETGRDPR